MRKWIDKKFVGAKVALENVMSDETGDTNFISIAIILGIVLVVAMTFIGYKDRIMDKVATDVAPFLGQ